jgi:hypothetical protein
MRKRLLQYRKLVGGCTKLRWQNNDQKSVRKTLANSFRLYWQYNVLVTKKSSEPHSAYMRITVLKRFSAPYARRRHENFLVAFGNYVAPETCIAELHCFSKSATCSTLQRCPPSKGTECSHHTCTAQITTPQFSKVKRGLSLCLGIRLCSHVKWNYIHTLILNS